TALADMTAYPQGLPMDGYGLGGFGTGGFGEAAGTYTWTSGPLAAGTWSFAVKPYDTAGNLGTAQTASVAIAAPPREPGLFPDGINRLHYRMIAGPRAVLTWNPSPSA